MNNKIEYKKAFKKQIGTAIAGFIICFILIYISMQPNIDTILLSLIYLFIIIILFVTLRIFKKQAQEARCPHCKTDLFEIIQVVLHKKIDLIFCPTCGKNIKL